MADRKYYHSCYTKDTAFYMHAQTHTHMLGLFLKGIIWSNVNQLLSDLAFGFGAKLRDWH